MDIPEDFDWRYYLANYNDLTKAGIHTEQEAINHYIKYGKQEGRQYKLVQIPEDFDWQVYLFNNEDLRKKGITTEKQLRKHWLTYGYKENRIYKNHITLKKVIFTCNITGNKVKLYLPQKELWREGVVYKGQNSRLRGLIYLLSKKLFGKVIPLISFPPMKHLTVMGMSDNPFLASKLRDVFNYTNTFYHQKPFLNIYKCDNHYNKYDFIISSDVFEHISPYPDLQIAFNNLYKMLKSNGFLIFSVPFTFNDITIEHFPNLYDYQIIKKNGKHILYNTTINGKKEKFDNLIFHGGPGTTLEMRIFSQRDLISRFNTAGFKNITFMDPDEKELINYGIYWGRKDCTIMLLEK